VDTLDDLTGTAGSGVLRQRLRRVRNSPFISLQHQLLWGPPLLALSLTELTIGAALALCPEQVVALVWLEELGSNQFASANVYYP